MTEPTIVAALLPRIWCRRLGISPSKVLLALSFATGLGHPPLAFLYEVLFGASQSFLNPIGYHTTNLVDFRPCRYRFLDVTRYGLPHTLIMTLLVPFLLCRHFNL
jgi:di/tricarboxylate transporter